MKVSDYIALKLAAAGLSHAFLVQGAANNDLIYSIADRTFVPGSGPKVPNIEYVCPMHEQAAGFMAEGWSKVTGKPGLAIGTSGPGGQNLLTPICNFHYDSVPGIFITGQVNSAFMRQSEDVRQVGFQEWPATNVFFPVTKWSVQVLDPKRIRWVLERALWIAQEGRPGPVVIDIPIDVQRADVNPAELQSFVVPLPERFVDLNQLEEFVDDFYKAQRPVVLIGGGVRGYQAEQALDSLAEFLRVPLFPTWNALDVVSSDHPWYGGRIGTYAGPGRNFAVQNCDLLLAIGCRLSGRITGGNIQSFARGAKRYVVDVDTSLLAPKNQQLPFHVNIQSDATCFMRALENCLRKRQIDKGLSSWPNHEEWATQAFIWRNRYDPVSELSSHSYSHIHPYLFARVLSEALPAKSTIVYDCGGNAVVMNHAFRTKKGQRYFSNNGNSPMGFAFAAALGAWFADPSRIIVCVIGDGGFCMNSQELQTLKNYGAKVKTFILDNRIYGITKSFQDTHFAGRYEASGPEGYKPPAFCLVAEGYKVANCRLTEHLFMQETIDHVLGFDEGFVCVVESPEFHTYEPRIAGWATPIEDMSPPLSRAEFRNNMYIEPLPGWEEGKYGPYHMEKK